MNDIARHAGTTELGASGLAPQTRSPRRRLMRPFLLVAFFGFALMGCDDPCEDLHKKVCEDISYLKANKRHCELMNEQSRREALPKDYCESILKSIARQ